jgi:hypothetical protein
LTKEDAIKYGSLDCDESKLCNPRSKDKNHWAKCPVRKPTDIVPMCPIVDVRIINKEKADKIRAKKTFSYELRDFTANELVKVGDTLQQYFLAFSTTDSDENPLTDIRAASVQPCVDPAKVDNQELFFTRYPMEKY